MRWALVQWLEGSGVDIAVIDLQRRVVENDVANGRVWCDLGLWAVHPQKWCSRWCCCDDGRVVGGNGLR